MADPQERHHEHQLPNLPPGESEIVCVRQRVGGWEGERERMREREKRERGRKEREGEKEICPQERDESTNGGLDE